MDWDTCFSGAYADARTRFREAAIAEGFTLQTFALADRGREGEELAMDVATRGAGKNAIVLSSGVHGVEGHFGSAVQLALLKSPRVLERDVRLIFVHAVNPHGFSWGRRFDQNNVDLNRNFLLEAELYQGAPPDYAALNALLNPQCPPSDWDGFLVRASWVLATKGMRRLKQAIAGGQFEFPQGLFFGGAKAAWANQILADNMSGWLGGGAGDCGKGQCDNVLHLDFHTGLGKWGRGELLIDYPLTDFQRDWLSQAFGRQAISESNSQDGPYTSKGGWGRWCVAQRYAPNYLYACAEFGTYSPIRVLRGLRAENQMFHWGNQDDRRGQAVRRRLIELFCPASSEWRRRTVSQSVEWVRSAMSVLE